MNIFEGLNFELGIKELQEDLPRLKEFYKIAAQAMHSYYEALVAAGFTKGQALEVVIAHGFNPESASMGKYETFSAYDGEDEHGAPDAQG